MSVIKHIYNEYEKNDIQMGQYHFETNLKLLNLVSKLLIHNRYERALMIIRQGKGMFTQYGFENKYWIGGDGEIKFVLKSDG